jgi:hypothetical protein
MPYTTIEQIKEAMQLMDGRDCDTWWCVIDDEIKCGLNANDLFYWACADLEWMEPEDLELMRQCKADCIAACGNDAEATELFACRKRKMRPQKPCYKHYPESVWPLFDACGGEQGDRG